MSKIAEIHERIGDTQRLIAKHEKMLLDHPEQSDTIMLSMRSLQKMKSQLEADYDYAAKTIGLDICRFRIISDSDNAHISALTNAVLSFQKLISTVYDSVKNGPKEKFVGSAEVIKESSFDLGYTYSGSIGFALTIPNERLLSDEFKSHIDETIEASFLMAKSKNTKEISNLASKYGHASVRALHKWASSHAKYGLSIDAEWNRGQKIRNSLLFQYQEFEHLKSSISNTSAETESTFKISGTLTMADVTKKKFSLDVPDSDLITGSFVDAIDESHEVTVPKRYEATITKVVKVQYAMDKEEVKYHLDSLRAL